MDYRPKALRPMRTAARFDGTAARQLDLLDEPDVRNDRSAEPRLRPGRVARPRPLRLLQKDIYAELARRRRRAQVRARHVLDRT